MEKMHSALTGAGMATTFSGAAVSWMMHLEAILRIGASVVAIVSGVVVIYFQIKNRNKNK
jgi:hypothetical protein